MKMRPGLRHAIGAGLVTAIGLLAASQAQAHVKWFTATNGTTPPHPPIEVMSPLFLGVLAAAVMLVFVGFMLDNWVACRWPGIVGSGIALAPMEERLIRAATGAYFIFVSSHGGVILTPELHSTASWIVIVQFLSALALIWRPTCIVAGAGILLLYAFAVSRYGVFHMTDYVFFPALSFYLGSMKVTQPRIVALREPILTGALAFSLAWTAIEKFLYPQWTYAVVATHPGIAFGLYVPFVVVVAGFVEFTLAFYLVTGRGLVRAGGAGYALIFIAAMPSFGKLDVYGHLVIVATLLITVLRGATPLQYSWHLKGKSLVADASWITFLYIVTLLLFFIGYYLLQKTALM